MCNFTPFVLPACYYVSFVLIFMFSNAIAKVSRSRSRRRRRSRRHNIIVKSEVK